MPETSLPLGPSESTRSAFGPILAAIDLQFAHLSAEPEVAAVLPGFRDDDDAARPAMVIAVLPTQPADARGRLTQLAQTFGVPVAIREASPLEQAAYLARSFRAPIRDVVLEQWFAGAVVAFRAPVRGDYKGPAGARLETVEDTMELVACASPDAGWPVLREFLSVPVRDHMTIGIYQFTARHVYLALRKTMLADPNAVLHMTVHPTAERIPDGGTKSDDIYGPEVVDRLERALGDRFDYARAMVGSEGTFGTSYHIKVAVADGERFWLSSGNLQSSNQPPFDPLNEPDELPPSYQRSYNREYHVTIRHRGLARTFRTFLEHDFATARSGEEPSSALAPDLLIAPEPAVPAFAPPARYFAPLRLNRPIRVTPLLTPDNYASETLELVRSARETLYFQNQYIGMNADGNFPEFDALIAALLDRIEADVDVRIICRDLMEQRKLDMLLALGFPRKVFRFMSACHVKTILVDGKRVLLGSHNWSNEGTVSNRDASLLFDDEEIAAYYQDIFLYDWENRANRKPRASQPSLARERAGSFAPMERVPWSAVYEDTPWPVAPAVVPPDATTAAAKRVERMVSFEPGGSGDDLVFNGIDGTSGQYLIPPKTIADAAAVARRSLGAPPPAEVVDHARSRAGAEVFGLPFGVDPNDLYQSGWGVVWAPNTPSSIKDSLKELIDHRRSQVPAARFREIEYRAGESARDFLKRHNVTFGNVKPTSLPYHLLLVGAPDEIPFEFQYLLDLEYSVGRLALDSPGDYGRYATSVVSYETGATTKRRKQVVFFGTKHAGDAATTMSATDLIGGLHDGGDPPSICDELGYGKQQYVGAGATRDRLTRILKGVDDQPAVLFTATHGMGFPVDHPRQLAAQGALLTQNWPGLGSIEPAHYFSAADVPDDAQLHGMVGFLFACFGAGTPRLDSYPRDGSPVGQPIASAPFVAALPKRLLTHPKGGALAVIGHVDLAWGYSIRPNGLPPQLTPFRNCLGTILTGGCIGNSTHDFSLRASGLSQELLDLVRASPSAAADQALVWSWIERNDARSYMVLGDPATRLRRADLVS
jgi:hypothetical protein